MATKLNDWLIASLNNPDFTPSDFRNYSDMNLDNTLFLSKDSYQNSQFVLNHDTFKNEQGEFSLDKFTEIYNNVAKHFKDFSQQSIENDYEWSMWDDLRPTNGKIKNPNFSLDTILNPEHIGISIGEFNEITPSKKSKRELALDSLIFDPSTGKYTDHSLNDISFFNDPIAYIKSLWEDPIVYATYDQDEKYIDPFTGKEKIHYKGEFKVNEFGEYYTEYLNGRSLIGKEVVSACDYITPENSTFNKYDFMDSDDLDKSIAGTVTKAAATVAPLLLGGYLGAAYQGFMVTKELVKTFPMLYGMVNGLTGSDNVDSPLLNTIAAYGHKFSSSTSDYSKENTFSFENIGNLMSDVATLWGLQKAIGATFSKLAGGGKNALLSAQSKAANEYYTLSIKAMLKAMSGDLDITVMGKYIGTANIGNLKREMLDTGKWMDTAFGKAALNKFVPAAEKLVEKNAKLGLDLSLVYMALISNTDVYDSILENGGTPFEAAAIALGSTVGMFSVDKYLGLGELFFNDEPSRLALRQAAKNSASALKKAKNIGDTKIRDDSKKGIINNIIRGIDSGKNLILNYESAIKDKTLGFVGKSLGEGLEEVSEELVSDLSKTLGEMAGKLGIFSQTDYGAWDNAGERYAMSALGGSLGGAMFYGVDLVRNRNLKEVNNDLIYLLRQGKKDEVISELTRLKDRGELGSTSLSLNTTTTEDGKTVYLTAENEEDSQNAAIYKLLVDNINLMDLILNENQLKLSEDELFDKMVLGEYRANALQDLVGNVDGKGISYITKYQEDFLKLANSIAEVELEIKTKYAQTKDSAESSENFKDEIEKLKAKRDDLLKQRDELFGKGSVGYVEKMLFAMDTELSGHFITLTKALFVRDRFGKSIKDLNAAEKELAEKEYENYSKNVKGDLDTAFKLFKQMQELLNPSLKKISKIDFGKELQQLRDIMAASPRRQLVNWDTKLDSESEEDYNSRNTKKESENDEEFENRKAKRLKDLNDYNTKNLVKWVLEFAKLPTDRSSHRELRAHIGVLKKEVLNAILKKVQIKDPTEFKVRVDQLLKLNSEISQEEALDKAFNESLTNLDLTNAVRTIIETKGVSDYKALLTELENILKDNLSAGLTTPGFLKELMLWEWVREQSGLDINIVDKNTFYLAVSNWLTNQHAAGNVEATVLDAIDAMEKDDREMDIFSEELGNINRTQLVDYFNRKQAGNTTFEEDSELIEQSDERDLIEIDKAADLLLPKLLKGLVGEVLPSLINNETIDMLDALDAQKFIDSPIFDVLENISSQIRDSKNKVNVGEFLKEIYSLFSNSESGKDFHLTDDLIEILKLIIQDLLMALAFSYAASVKSSYIRPVGHNKTINEYYKRHEDVLGKFTELPELDANTGDLLLLEAVLLISEINSWIRLSLKNEENKLVKFTKSQEALNKTQLEFFETYRNVFKEIVPHVDLLQGYEEIDKSNEMLAVVLILQLLHNNFLKSGLKIEDVLDKVIPAITHKESLIRLQYSYLDENLTLKDFTDYDKFTLIVGTLALDTKDFYTKLKQFITDNDNIAPVSILEYVSKLSYSADYDSDLINRALHWLNDNSESKLPILENTSIIPGAGGSGKSKVIAKYSCGDGTNTWVSGPTESQIANLNSGTNAPLPKATGKSIKAILDIALGEDSSTFIAESEKLKSGSYFSKVTGLDDHDTLLLKEDLEVLKIDDAPKYIVIDEATWINTALLLLISKFCVKNNIQLLLLGDPSLNGLLSGDQELNINYEVVLAWRSPKLFISLRDTNIQKAKNLNPIVKEIDRIKGTSTSEELISISKDIMNNFPELHYYNKEVFAGELITSEISDDLLSKLLSDPTKTIAVISDNPDSEIYKLLHDKNGNVVLITSKDVQGQEFDYVVVDKKWELNASEPSVTSAVNLLHFLQDLYTMISRSKDGTVIIDNGLSKIINNVSDTSTSITSDISAAIEKFRPKRLEEIDLILAVLEEMGSVKKGEPKEEPKGEPPIEIKPDPPEGPDDGGGGVVDEPIEPIEQDLTTPVRAYSEMSFSGLDISQTTWSNPNNGSNRDLGIVIEEGETIKTAAEKSEKVLQVLLLKGLFNFGLEYYDRLPQNLRRKFDKSAFEEAIFSIRVDNYTKPENGKKDSSQTAFIGMTMFRNGENLIKDADGNEKVVSIVATIKGKDGKEYDLTLAGVANPDTWIGKPGEETSEEKAIKHKIKSAKILKEIFDGGKMKNGSESEKNALVKLLSQLTGIGDLITPKVWDDLTTDEISKRVAIVLSNAEKLNEYLLHLPDNKRKYKRFIDEVVEKGEGKYELASKPRFSGFTRVYNIGEYIRLEELNSTHSAYELKSKYVTTSPVYVPMEQIKGLPKSVVGKPIMFVTTNPFLLENSLAEIYLALREDPTLPKHVRMLLLEHAGVSFSSLYHLKWLWLYQHVKEGKDFISPVEMGPAGAKMYVSAWNYRADLSRFIASYTDWLPNSKYNDNTEIELLLEEENKEYLRLLEEDKAALESELRAKNTSKEDIQKALKQVRLDEQSFRERCNPKLKEKILQIWDFNDGLSETVKNFRLGYSYKHGVYIRKLTNLKNSKLHTDVDHALGIYINPSVAEELYNVINALFTNILDKLIPNEEPHKIDELSYMDRPTAEKWALNISDEGHMTFDFCDSNGTILHKELSDNTEYVLKKVFAAFVRSALYLEIRNFDQEAFDDPGLYENGLTEYAHHKITYTDSKTGEEKVLHWSSLHRALNGGNSIQTVTNGDINSIPHIPGVVSTTFTDSNGKKTTGYIDRRIDNLFSLMFHGLVGLEEENNFENDEPRADMLFKHGIFTDSMILVDPNNKTSTFKQVSTNRKLYKVNAIAQAPNIYFEAKLAEGPSGKPKTVVKPAPAAVLQEDPLKLLKLNVISELTKLDILGVEKIVNSKTSENEIMLFAKSEIKSKFNSYFEEHLSDPINTLVESIELKSSALKINRLIDRPEFANLTIVDLEWDLDNDVLKVSLSDGSELIISLVNDEINIKKVGKNANDTVTVGDFISACKSILELLNSDEGDSVLAESLQDSLDSDYAGIPTSELLTFKDVLSKVNEIQKLIHDDPDEPEWHKLYEKIWTDLENLKSLCFI